MDYLKSDAEEYGLPKIINHISQHPNVQGAILTLDNLWLLAWQMKEEGYDVDWDYLIWASERRLRRMGFPFPDSEFQASPYFSGGPPDLQWRPEFWSRYHKVIGLEPPPAVRLIICLSVPSGHANSAPPDFPKTDLPVSFEVRPIARLSSLQRTQIRPVVGGVSVGTGSKVHGTLGGIIKDQDNNRFGMTCAHVFPQAHSVNQPAMLDDAAAESIGSTKYLIQLQSCTAPGPCNPYSNHQHITSVDTSLIQLDEEIQSDFQILSIGSLAGVVPKTSMTPGQEIAFEGRTSGYRIAEVGGLAVFYRFHGDNETYCFRDLFEVRWRNWMRQVFGPVVRAGDSGAWVCAETDQGPGWCGQVIGEDRHVGYAAFADNTVAAWSNAGRTIQIN